MPNDSVLKSIRAFLNYSLRPVEYDYTQLTDSERKLVTKEEFAELTAWLKKT